MFCSGISSAGFWFPALQKSEHNKDFGVRFRGYNVTIQRLLEAEQKDEQTHLGQIIAFFKEAK